ncbi:MAG: glycosyltransferase [Bacteroidota bacterium]
MKNNQKKIAFLLTSLVSGGEERTASVLAKTLAQREELIVVLFNKPIDFQLPDDIPVHVLRPEYRWRVWRLVTLVSIVWQYYRFCQREGITHSIAFDSLPNFVNALIKMLGWRGVAVLRESNHVSTRYPANTFRGQLFRWLIKKLYPKANQVLVNANRIGEDLRKNYKVQIPIHLSLNPLDLPYIQKSTETDLTSAIEPFTFVHVGMFRAQKNHHLLLQAFSQLRDLPVRLWIVGKGDLADTIKQQIINLRLEEKVALKGFHANPYPFMANADCMVLSSNYEGAPNVLSEGLACCLPIISTDCPTGPREIIAPNTPPNKRVQTEIELAEYGILTPVSNAEKLAEAMRFMYESDRYRKGDFFKKRVEPFRVERIVAELLEVLEAT